MEKVRGNEFLHASPKFSLFPQISPCIGRCRNVGAPQEPFPVKIKERFLSTHLLVPILNNFLSWSHYIENVVGKNCTYPRRKFYINSPLRDITQEIASFPAWILKYSTMVSNNVFWQAYRQTGYYYYGTYAQPDPFNPVASSRLVH